MSNNFSIRKWIKKNSDEIFGLSTSHIFSVNEGKEGVYKFETQNGDKFKVEIVGKKGDKSFVEFLLFHNGRYRKYKVKFTQTVFKDNDILNPEPKWILKDMYTYIGTRYWYGPF